MSRSVATSWHFFRGEQARDLTFLGEALGGDYLFLTDLLPLGSTPSGFSFRYASIIQQLCARGPTALHVALRKSNPALRASPWEIARAVSAVFPDLSHLILTIHDPAGVRHRVLRGARQVVCRRPSTTLPDLPSSYRIEAKLVVAQAGLAHLGLDRSLAATVYLLEEGFERRSKELGHPIKSRLKYPITISGLHRLYARISATGMPVVVLTEDERRHFSRWIEEESLHVVPLSIDLAAFADSSRGARREESGRFTIGVLGRLGDPRNQGPIRRLLEAAEDSGVSWNFQLVGLGAELYSSWQRRANHITIDITGFVNHIEPYYLGLDCVVIPETLVTGCKTSLLQAWAAGVPCVVSQATGRSCAVRDGEDGLVYAGERDALAALERVRADAELSTQLSINGRQRLQDHDGARSATRVVDLLLGA
jgi:glycosyltransferase involved in cell wall biosynthesis